MNKITYYNKRLYIGAQIKLDLALSKVEIFNEDSVRFSMNDKKVIARKFDYFLNADGLPYSNAQEILDEFNKEKDKLTLNPTLVIRDLVPNPDINILNFDFTLLAEVTKESPLYDKGRKTESSYYYNEFLLAKKIFEDIYNNQNRLSKLKMTINWYNHDGTIGLTKNQIVKRFNRAEAKTELRKRRARSIDYLIASAEEKGQGWFIDILLRMFKTEIELFIENGTDDFEKAIIAELTNPNSMVIDEAQGITVSMVLNSKLPPTDLHPTGQTVAEGILEEI